MPSRAALCGIARPHHIATDKTAAHAQLMSERVELERDLATTHARLLEARSTLQESQQARVAYKDERHGGDQDRAETDQ